MPSDIYTPWSLGTTSLSNNDFKLNYTKKIKLPEYHEADYENAESNHSILHLVQMWY